MSYTDVVKYTLPTIDCACEKCAAFSLPADFTVANKLNVRQPYIVRAGVKADTELRLPDKNGII